MSTQIEHVIYGTRERLEHFAADLPAGIAVTQVPDGLLLREVLREEDDVDVATARMEACAQEHGVAYDGYGLWLNDALSDNTDRGRNIQAQTFASRTGIKAGHGFAFALPDGRFGHAIHIGSDRKGILLLEITGLVVWHTPFAVLPLSGAKPLAQLPCAVLFRCMVGWPDPQEVARLETLFGISGTDNPAGWNSLLLAMADAGERLTGLQGFSVWTARVGRNGLLKLVEDYATHPFPNTGDSPMPWEPVDMNEIVASLAGAPDMIAVRDNVT
jgi:hypothetical protein